MVLARTRPRGLQERGATKLVARRAVGRGSGTDVAETVHPVELGDRERLTGVTSDARIVE